MEFILYNRGEHTIRDVCDTKTKIPRELQTLNCQNGDLPPPELAIVGHIIINSTDLPVYLRKIRRIKILEMTIFCHGILPRITRVYRLNLIIEGDVFRNNQDYIIRRAKKMDIRDIFIYVDAIISAKYPGISRENIGQTTVYHIKN